MRKNIKYLVLLTIITCIVTGCDTTTKTRFPSGKVKPKNLNYLGQSEISVSYRRYLGVIHSIDSVNGREYIPYESEKYKLGCRLRDNRLKKRHIKFMKNILLQIISKYPMKEE